MFELLYATELKLVDGTRHPTLARLRVCSVEQVVLTQVTEGRCSYVKIEKDKLLRLKSGAEMDRVRDK